MAKKTSISDDDEIIEKASSAAAPRVESDGGEAARIAFLEERLREESALRIEAEERLQRTTQEFEASLQQRTELLQELVMQLQTEIAHRDEVENQLRKRTDVMHDFIKQLEREMEDRRLAEAHLRSSEERFRNVIEKSPVGICITNQASVFEYVNPAYCALLGYSAKELQGKPFSVLFTPEETPALKILYKKIFDGKAEMRGERTLLTKSGQPITVLTDSVQIVNNNAPQEQEKKKLIVFVLDITRRKQAEDMLRRAKMIIDKSPAVIYQFSLQHNFPLEFVSDNIKQFGFSAHDFTSGAISFLHHVHPDDRDKIMDSFRHLAQTKTDHLRREYRLLTPSGKACWVEDNLMAVYNDDNAVVAYQGVLLDIDERRRAEEEMNKALLKEKELVELKTRFVTIASHEFRTPLTSILLSVGILRDFAAILTEEERQESLARISGGVHHMTKLLEDLLVFGKAESGEMRPKPTRLPLQSWLEEIVTKAREHYGRRRELVYAPPPASQEYWGDESMLKQILEHLLSNADKFSPEGAAVSLDIHSENNTLKIIVADQGIGIPEDDLPRIFEPFHRGKNIGNIGGTGMGLAIVEKMVLFLRGSIAVQSAVGKGTTFTVSLPLASSDAATA
jgi:PAS domain S-box-containing protein